MKEIQITTTLTCYDHIGELPQHIQKLMEHAVNARKKAYAPYSKFRVGAALQLENGVVITGNNQENAAYPSGLCAERVAIFHAGAEYPNVKIQQIAITATSDNHINKTPIPPCGSCRQSIAEYEMRQDEAIEIYFMGGEGKIMKSNSLKDLLPLVFDKTYL
ncbi:cytidine deaminase [Kordia periserrulae]|uniref:Cytidine deaminase n=1 Tax=Kordia periserrulae TaxID=701523 RepID=A0A2T6BXS0_9FLAO|nr:cytidine deaminase [Kordia periserrulae]PTX60881.1 cytidine deaminase [Kordia periserrulae]